jgi:hypothetical protein
MPERVGHGRANGKSTDVPPRDQPLPNELVFKFYASQEEFFARWASDLYHVAMRIRAVEESTPDLGTLIETQEKRYSEIDLLLKD